MNKSTKTKILPKLRFPEFKESSNWVEKTLANICHMQAGKFVRASEISENNLFPCYGGNGLRGYTATSTHNGDYSLIGRQGALCGNVNFVSGEFHATEHAVVVTPNDGINNHWLNVLLDYLNLNQYATGQAQPGLSVERLKEVIVSVPLEIEEQKKIADSFFSIDLLISAQNDKVENLKKYKNGLLQQLFPQDGEAIPRLRFPEFEGNNEWQTLVFENVFERITTKNVENNQNVLTISAQKGLVSQLDFFNKKIAAKNVSGYYLIHKGDFAYNKSYSQGYPMGALKLLKDYDKGVVSTLYICFRAKKDFNIFFFEQYFESGLLNKEIEKIAQEGARNHGLLNVGVSDFFTKIELLVPQPEEQERIANFFIALDEQISIEEEKLSYLNKHKKGLLQQLFPSLTSRTKGDN